MYRGRNSAARSNRAGRPSQFSSRDDPTAPRDPLARSHPARGFGYMRGFGPTHGRGTPRGRGSVRGRGSLRGRPERAAASDMHRRVTMGGPSEPGAPFSSAPSGPSGQVSAPPERNVPLTREQINALAIADLGLDRREAIIASRERRDVLVREDDLEMARAIKEENSANYRLAPEDMDEDVARKERNIAGGTLHRINRLREVRVSSLQVPPPSAANPVVSAWRAEPVPAVPPPAPRLSPVVPAPTPSPLLVPPVWTGNPSDPAAIAWVSTQLIQENREKALALLEGRRTDFVEPWAIGHREVLAFVRLSGLDKVLHF
ncbi:hypothetical protein M501DRAFT_1001810 [Patellaria atrata CBS 101060]|uniref:Uncharacterized protein n=1 Tax=Patellaria atrata CBS 101060 TaxID=1346257 RepID=A0A9P4SE53_9PEZI|nr:hypothetical protein M501DRAFT_1001810 [Patellaria atrata CBS 101060]